MKDKRMTDEQQELMEVLGEEAYQKLVRRFSGCQVYICQQKTLERASRNEAIRKKFNGFNYRALAVEFGLSEKTIRLIIAEQTKND